MRRFEHEEVLVCLSVCSESVSLKLGYLRSGHVPRSCSRASQVIRVRSLGSEHYLNDITLENDILLQPPPPLLPPRGGHEALWAKRCLLECFQSLWQLRGFYLLLTGR